MSDLVKEFMDGIKKPFQTEAEREANKASAVASYAAVIAIFALIRQ